MLHPLLVNDLVYPSITSNLVTLATLSPWSDSVYTHTCSPFSRQPLLRLTRTVDAGLLIRGCLEKGEQVHNYRADSYG